MMKTGSPSKTERRKVRRGRKGRQPSLRAIPAVEKVLQELRRADLPRPIVVSMVRRELAELRSTGKVPPFDDVIHRISGALEALKRGRIQPVINGTGILVHTNLGRAPLGTDVMETLREIGSHYNNLEFDLTGGERGGRAAYLEYGLALLCGAPAATVVNNCAAALVLMLRHFTARKPEVIISRGELIQIGGGFRIPEILEASGARLREVGTTNKTALSDYQKAIGPNTALLLKVHRSNFFMGGFVESPSTEEISALARRKRLPFVEDLGSGAVQPTERLGIEHEPTPAEVLRRGVHLVCCSGDKLFGGPQAGIIAGQSKLVAALKRDPFFRALRCDKLILSALQTTVDHYLAAGDDPAAVPAVPVLELLKIPLEDLKRRAAVLVESLRGLPVSASIGQGEARIGGGTLPKSVIPSVTVDLVPANQSLEELSARLRAASLPIIGYMSAGRFKIDLRTIFPRQDEALAGVLRAVFKSNSQPQNPVEP